MATERPIFILGCPRSGMTLLRLMLRTHPRIAIAPETRFLLSAYEDRGAYGDLREIANRRALADWIVAGAGTRFDELGLDPRAVASEIVAGPPTLGSAAGIVLRAYARRLGRPRWGDMRPAYVQHIDELSRLFPDAQFIHVIRDGRDCVAALKRSPWWRMGTYHAIATWTQAIDAGRTAARRLPLDSYYETQYEHLMSDPEGTLRGLCEFLEEEYAPEMASPSEAASPEWRNWRAGVSTSTGLEPWELSLCETVMADRLQSYGYSIEGTPRPPLHHLARYSTITTHRRLAARKRTLLDRATQATEPHTVASHLASVPEEQLARDSS